MTIETIFRGIFKKTNEFVYGDLIHNEDGEVLIGLNYCEDGYWNRKLIDVIPKTVGQYIGIKDKNGIEIYEGDILEAKKRYYTQLSEGTSDYIGLVEFEKGSFILNNNDGYLNPLNKFFDIKIIGNIFQNPELLEAK